MGRAITAHARLGASLGTMHQHGWLRWVISEIARTLKPGGGVCLNVGKEPRLGRLPHGARRAWKNAETCFGDLFQGCRPSGRARFSSWSVRAPNFFSSGFDQSRISWNVTDHGQPANTSIRTETFGWPSISRKTRGLGPIYCCSVSPPGP